jgi:signal transduction histidine kinase
MRANSLWFRLIASSVVIAVVLLTSAAFLLNTVFVQALERNFDQRLRASLDGILAAVELGPDDRPQLQNQLADTRFSLPLSGWYWQINEAGQANKITSSPSLLEQQLTAPADTALTRGQDGIAAFSMRDQQGTNLRAILQSVKLFGGSKSFDFIVTGNFDELKSEISAFQRTLMAILGAVGLALLGALLLQVRFTLRPLAEMQHQLNDIRSGKAELLAENFPRELQPVADELNLVVQSNFEIVDRARMQVGNLAHALKTPISVLGNEARQNKGPLSAKVIEQLDVMRDQVNLYLDRARRAARAQAIGASADVEPVLQALARTIQRINAARKMEISVTCPANLRFRGERQDLEEMVGNLVDNASKWCRGKIEIRAEAQAPVEDGRLWLTITVDDDGPGIPAEKRDMALERGKRLDESKPGSGLGMSIISETAAMYSGQLSLNQANIGGLRAILKLPMIV